MNRQTLVFTAGAVALGLAGTAHGQTATYIPAQPSSAAMAKPAIPELIPPPPQPIPVLRGLSQANGAAEAQEGSSDEQWAMSETLRFGDPQAAKDPASALTWLRLAARHGNRAAMVNLAFLYRQKNDAPAPEADEPDWLQTAADEGWGEAQDDLGRMYAEGDGRPQDLVEALKWFDLAASATDGELLGASSADNGYAVAGVMTPAQIIEAKKRADQWTRTAPSDDQIADQGWTSLRRHYYDQAISLLTPVATAGFARAQFYLGMTYRQRKDPAHSGDAASWFRKAAEQDQPGAEHMMAVLLTAGDGVPQDLPAAVEWDRKAAAHGLSLAEDDLGMMYSQHLGVAEDDAIALDWLSKAAAQGMGRAQYLLGNFYTFGTAVPKDIVEAYKWKTLAVAYTSTGSTYQREAKSDLDWMAKSMTQAQIDQATAEAKAWHPVFEVPR